jgi:hypothetical protein
MVRLQNETVWQLNDWFFGYLMTLFELQRLYSIEWNGKVNYELRVENYLEGGTHDVL